MSQASAREALKVEIEDLPEDLAEEVLDFIEFVRHRRDEQDFLWRQARMAEGRVAASPDEVQTVTRSEWETQSDRPGH